MKDYKLDNEEQELINSIESGEWVSVDNLQEEIKKHRQIAKNTLKKDARINIRISSRDLNLIKAKAAELGIPYQTLISSILHQYTKDRSISL